MRPVSQRRRASEVLSSGLVENVRWHPSPAAVRGDRHRFVSFDDRFTEARVVIRFESPVSDLPGPARFADDHLKITRVVLRKRRVDQLTVPAYVEARAAEVFGSWAANAFLSVVHCFWSVVARRWYRP